MPGGIPNLCQRSAARQRMADKCVPAVVDRQAFQPGQLQ